MISSGTAYANRYADVTHKTVFTSVWNAVISDGMATETIVESTRIMKNPITSDHRAGHAWRGISGSWGGVATGSGEGCDGGVVVGLLADLGHLLGVHDGAVGVDHDDGA